MLKRPIYAIIILVGEFIYMIKKEYSLSSSKVDSDKNIMVISELHYNDMKGFNRTRLLQSVAETENISHIIIPGDFYNASDEKVYRNSSRIVGFLNNMSRYAPVCYVQGNSEQESDYLPNFVSNPESFLSPKVHLLGQFYLTDNNPNIIFADSDINIVGLGLDKAIYDYMDKNKPGVIAKYYGKWFSALEKMINKDRFNILVCHDPMIGETLSYLQYPDLFDLIITGHRHEAFYPDELLSILATSNEYMEEAFPKYKSGFYNVKGLNSKLFVADGITKYGLANSLLENEHEAEVDFVRIRKI